MKYIKYLFVVLFIAVSAIVNAQDTTSIATEKVEVIKNYEAIIQQASMKKMSKEGLQKDIQKINYNYKLQSKVDLDFDRPQEIIRPLTYEDPKVKNTDIKDGQLYGAYGNYKTLNFGAAYHYYIEDWLEAGIKFDHFSASDDSLPHQKFNNNNAELYASYFLSKVTKVGAEVNFNKNSHYTPLIINQDSLIATEQSYNSYGGRLSLASTAFESIGLAFRSRIAYNMLEQKQDSTSEKLFKAEINAYKKLSERLAFELPFEFRNTNFQLTDSEAIKVNDLLLRPQIQLKATRYSATVGVEYIKADTSNFLFPIVDLVIHNLYQDFKLHLYTESNFDRNSMHRLSAINPYYRSDLTRLRPYYLRSYAINFEMPFRSFVGSINVAYNNYTGEDIHFDRADTNRAIVNTINRNEWRISPQINVNRKNLALSLRYDYNIFLGDNATTLTYRPKSIFGLKLKENFINNKIQLYQELRYVSSRRNSHVEDDDRTLDAFVDVSLGGEIKIGRSLIVFAKASNVLGRQYELWYNHPVFERQIWGGLRFNL